MIKERLTRKPDGSKIPVPTHLFFFITLIFGIAFGTPPFILDVGTTKLFAFATATHPYVPFIFGGALLLTTALNTAMLLTRKPVFGFGTAMLGFIAWLYAGVAYIMGGFYFGLIVAALPNIIFWGWYYMQVNYWKQYLKHGLDRAD